MCQWARCIERHMCVFGSHLQRFVVCSMIGVFFGWCRILVYFQHLVYLVVFLQFVCRFFVVFLQFFCSFFVVFLQFSVGFLQFFVPFFGAQTVSELHKQIMQARFRRMSLVVVLIWQILHLLVSLRRSIAKVEPLILRGAPMFFLEVATSSWMFEHRHQFHSIARQVAKWHCIRRWKSVLMFSSRPSTRCLQ